MNSQLAVQALTNYDVNLQPNQIDIRTDTLEPIQSSARKFTFRLDQAGYLDLNSMVVFKLQSSAGDDNNCRVNVFNGALGGIKRAIIQVGDHILNDVQDVNKYATLTRLNVPPSQRNKFFGHYLGNQFHTRVEGIATDQGEEGTTSLVGGDALALMDLGVAGSIIVDPFKSGLKRGQATAGANARINSHRIGQTLTNNHQYGITLGMLFPALKGQKIPLFLFDKQRILLTIEFNQPVDYVCDITQNNYNAGNDLTPTNANISVQECRLVVDYIIMSSDIQQEVINQTSQEGGYRLEFYDVVNVAKTIGAGIANQRQDIEHRIGQNGREVHNIYMWKQYTNDNDFGSSATGLQALAGGFAPNHGSKGYLRNQNAIGVEDEEYNVEVNGREEFQDFKFNPVSQYNELRVALGRPLYVDRPMYCNDINTANSLLSMANGGILGTFKPLACALRNGEPELVGGGRQIGNYPIVFKYRYTPRNADNKNGLNSLSTIGGFNVNYFIEVSRVANIRNTNKGMSVVVSY